MVQREKLFTLEALKRSGGRLKANTAPGINGVPNEILKEVIRAYPEILLEAFNSCLRERRIRRGEGGRLEEAEVGPAEEEQQTSRRCLIL